MSSLAGSYVAAYNEDVSVCPGFPEFWITAASQKQLLMMTDLQGGGSVPSKGTAC